MPLFEKTLKTENPLGAEAAFLTGHSRDRNGRAAWLEANPAYINCRLKQLPADGSVRIKMSKDAREAEYEYLRHNNPLVMKDYLPQWWAIRLDNMVPGAMQESARNAWDEMTMGGLRCHGKHGDEDIRHGPGYRPTFHFGQWKRQSNPPMISSDTIQADVSADTQLARQMYILIFCGIISNILIHITDRVIKYDKNAMTRQRYIVANSPSAAVNGVRPDAYHQARRVTGCSAPLLFGKWGTMIACTTGQSERVHIDPNDTGYTLVMPLAKNGWGDDELPAEQLWGQVELPQLGYRIPLRPGQVLIFRASHLLHNVTPLRPDMVDRRLVVTVFVCTYLAEMIMSGYGEYFQTAPPAPRQQFAFGFMPV